MELFWVTTEDHDEDWFVVASSAEEASRFHEDAEGYDPGDATAEEILSLTSFWWRLVLNSLQRILQGSLKSMAGNLVRGCWKVF